MENRLKPMDAFRFKRKMLNLTLAVATATTLANLQDGSFKSDLDQKAAQAICTPSLPIISSEIYNPQQNEYIENYLQRLLPTMVNILGAKRFRVILLASSVEVKMRYGGQSDRVGAFMDPDKREIVMDDALNFPHEVAHAVDTAFDDISTSEAFLLPIPEYIRVQKGEVKKGQVNLKDMYEHATDDSVKKSIANVLEDVDGELATIAKLEDILGLPYPVSRELIHRDTQMLSYVRHIFVNAFLRYYPRSDINSEAYRNSFAQEYPEMWSAMDAFDKRLRLMC